MFETPESAQAALKASDPHARWQAAVYLGEHPGPAACQALLAALDDPDPRAHEAILQAIVAQDVPDRIAHLVAVLRGDQPGRRNAALSALIEIGARQPSVLVEALSHSSAEVRLHVAGVLGDLRDPATVSSLNQRLADPEEFPNVRHAAAQALGKIGDQSAVPVLLRAAEQGDFWVRFSAVEALGRLGDPQAVPALLQLLRQDAWMRPATVRALGEIGQVEAVPDLVAVLADQDDAVRAAAVEALLKIVVEPTVDPGLADTAPAALRRQIPVVPLRRELNSRQPPGSAYAAHLLGWLAAPEALPDLIDALGYEDETFRQAVVEALLRYGAEAVEPLLGALDHRQASVREHAVELIGMLADSSAVPTLLRHARDTSLAVRHALVRALGSLGGETAYQGLLDALLDDGTRDVALGVIGQVRDPALVNHLQRLLYEQTSSTRWAAAQALSLLGDEAAVSILLNATRLPDDHVRLPAAEALGRVRSNRAVTVLIEALGDRDWLVRQKAIEALGAIANGRAVAALLLLADEPERRVRRALVTALARVGDSRVLPALRALARDPNRWVRRAVMEIGAEFDDAGMTEILVTGLADGDPSVRQAALVSLGRRREPSVAAAVAAALRDTDTHVRLAAVRALSLVDPALAVTHLTGLASAEADAVVRRAVADALGELGLPETVAPLAVLLADTDQAVQAQAAEALALVGTLPALEVLASGLCYPAAKNQILAELARLGVPAFRVLLTCARADRPELRAAAAEALGLMRNTLALPTLRLLARDPDERVRAMAGQALAVLSAAPPPEHS